MTSFSSSFHSLFSSSSLFSFLLHPHLLHFSLPSISFSHILPYSLCSPIILFPFYYYPTLSIYCKLIIDKSIKLSETITYSTQFYISSDFQMYKTRCSKKMVSSHSFRIVKEKHYDF
jgi:hypothetical protein